MAARNAKDPGLNIFKTHLLDVCEFEGMNETSSNLDSVAVSSLVCKAEVLLENKLPAPIPNTRNRELESDLGNYRCSECVENALPAAKPTFKLQLWFRRLLEVMYFGRIVRAMGAGEAAATPKSAGAMCCGGEGSTC
jgi:hypothetical protein